MAARLPGLLALASIFAASGWIIWAVNSSLGWPAQVLHVLAASLVPFLIGGLIGIDAINIFLPLAVLSLATEGAILGGRSFGWYGAVVGVVAGLFLAPFAALGATTLVVIVAWVGSSRMRGEKGPGEHGEHEPGQQV